MNQYLAMLRESANLRDEIYRLREMIVQKSDQLEALATALYDEKTVPEQGCFMTADGKFFFFELNLGGDEKPCFLKLHPIDFLNESGV